MRADRLKLVHALKTRLSFANVLPVLALFLALGGTAYAAGVLPVNSVGTAQLKSGSVTSGKVKDNTLKAVDLAGNQLNQGSRGARGPEGPAGPGVAVDTSQVYTRGQSDVRYLSGGLVTVISSTTIPSTGNQAGTATCPAGYQAISGGSDASDNERMFLLTSEPVAANGGNLIGLSDGLHAAPTGWRVFVNNDSATTQTLKVVVTCAPGA